MIRHPQNSNLTLYEAPYFGIYPVQTQPGPLVTEYLERAEQVINQALQEYPRVFAFRVDLRYPADQYLVDVDSNQTLERFFASFRAKIRSNRDRALAANPYAHESSLRFIWCRELGQHGIPHYHVAILLNADAFCTLGRYELGRDNLFNRLHQAWASALGLSVDRVHGLVELPEKPFYMLQRNDQESIKKLFQRISYLCKAATKHYGNGVHGFGASRR